jgi:ElaB/YqjD/DUF883 family membrane-anchored ribosome-binding protein
MDDRLNQLLERIRHLEQELLGDLQEKEQRFSYEVRERKVRFKTAVAEQHRKLATRLGRYVREAPLFSILTAPFIWVCIVPVVLLDLVARLYQFVCFPVYGIPKVRRRDYIALDRRLLRYLNPLERLNCFYCEYVNGMLAYAQEIAGRTEQYWCPIKHAVRLSRTHSRYHRFLEYGDAESYRREIERIRRDFEDLVSDPKPADAGGTRGSKQD